jgi:hypothetical protein
MGAIGSYCGQVRLPAGERNDAGFLGKTLLPTAHEDISSGGDGNDRAIGYKDGFPQRQSERAIRLSHVQLGCCVPYRLGLTSKDSIGEQNRTS